MFRLYVKIMLVVSLVFSVGCASIKKVQTVESPLKDVTAAHEDTLAAEPSIVKVPIPADSFVLIEPQSEPSKKQIAITLNKVKLSTAVRAIAREIGVNTVFDADDDKKADNDNKNSSPVVGYTPPSNNNQNQEPVKDKDGKYFARRLTLDFKGSSTDLFRVLQEYTGYFYRLHNNSLIVRDKDGFTFRVPNNTDLLKSLKDSLEKAGATGISYDDLTSNVVFTANYPTYERVRRLLDDLKNNMSLVTMRVLLYNVRLTGEENRGIDWTKLVLGIRSQKQLAPFGLNGSTNNTSNTSNTSTNSTTDTSSTIASAFTNGVGVVAGSTGANVFLESSKMSLTVLANFMESYGKTKLMQNIFVQALSGRKASIEVVTETPYVSQIGIGAVTTNGTTSNTTQSTATTDKAKSGVTFDVTPFWSRAQGTLSVALKVGVYGVNRFLDLNAGNLGTFSQPETTKKSIETYLRITPTQVAVIGGLVYDQYTGSAAGLPGDTYLTKSTQATTQREELVVLLKPTIFEFVPQD